MDSLLDAFLWLALTACVAVLLLPALPALRQRHGRWRVHFLLQKRLPASHYTVLRDLTLRHDASSSETVHIDHLVISPFGVFVIVDCHVSGAVFGAERDAEWNRMGFRRKSAFPNPLRSCEERIQALQQILDVDQAMFHPMVVFTRDAEARTQLPPHVTPVGGLIPYIQVRTGELLGFEGAARVAAVIKSRRLPPGVPSAADRINRRKRSEGQRFGAQQAVLGLALMAVLASAAGYLADNLSDAPAPYPDARAQPDASPFVEGTSPPVIRLPGRVQPEPVRLGPEREAALLCEHTSESGRCACFEPGGGEVFVGYDACRALADSGQRVSQR